MFAERNSNILSGRPKLGTLMHSDANNFNTPTVDNSFTAANSHRVSNASSSSPGVRSSDEGSSPAYPMPSPWNNPLSPYTKSPWTKASPLNAFPYDGLNFMQNGLIGSLVREEGHIYSLATSGDLLYTGSDSKNIRVWKNLKEFSGFKSNSGLVKSIVISGERIFTGHQDGKIRLWRASPKDASVHKRIGSLPTFKESMKKSFNPKNYVEVRRGRRNVLRIKHFDAVSCLSLNEDQGLLYSGSWDKTVKVWRISDSKCVESIDAHEDAVNAVVSGYDSLVFTGSADGTVKVWRRESMHGRHVTKHKMMLILLEQENAVTSLAVEKSTGVIYCGSSDGLVNFWERDQKRWLVHGGVLRGHKLAVLCLAAAGNLVFSGSADKSICVWRRDDEGSVHTCLSVLTGHTGPVKCLAVEEDHDESNISKDDQRWIVYSGSLDKSVKVWRVSEQTPDLSQIQGM